nr:helix-turn-helix transcriptional regulator [Lachnospiraceae bacterium]
MKNFTGFLIKQQRLHQGLSQEALCRGICAVSYLSKIEQGLGHPSPAILQQLMTALGISYNQDAELLGQAQDTLDTYFDKYFHSETADREAAWLKLHQQEMENSELHLSWHLFNLYALLQKHGKSAPVCHQEAAYLARFLDYMEDDQLFLYYAGAGQVESEDQLDLLRMAENLNPTSFVKQSMAETYYVRKDYMNAIACAERAFSAAAEEGSLPILLWSSYLLGACYSNYNDLGFMLRYYKRARELSRSYDAAVTTLIDYQIGSAFLEHLRFTDAIPYLVDAYSPQKAGPDQRFLTALKLSVCYFEAGYEQLGMEYLRNAAGLKTARMPAIYDQLLRLADLRYLQGDRGSDEYEEILRELYESGEATLGTGCKRLFAENLIRLYVSQRKYKDALALGAEHGYVG